MNYLSRYRQELTPLIGTRAAAIMSSLLQVYFAFVGLFLLAFVVGAVLLGAYTTPGGLLIGACFIAGIACGVRTLVLVDRATKAASAYLTQEWGQPVLLAGVKLSLRWWRWRLDLERKRLAHGGGR